MKVVDVIVVTAVLSGCTNSADVNKEPVLTHSEPDSSFTAQAPSDHEEPFVGIPVWDDEAQGQALAAALSAMNAFARHSVDQREWWAELAPHLSAQALQAYSSVRVENVPVTTITAAPLLADPASPYLVTYVIPTDAGTYHVLLSRVGANSPWLVERITAIEAKQ